MMNDSDIVLVLHNIRSAHNVGAMLRTAEGFGVKTVWLSGYTPHPNGSEGKYMTRAEKDLAKTALGAETILDIRTKKRISDVLRILREEGYVIIALEQSIDSIPIHQYKPTRKIALIPGNEVGGVGKNILKECDGVLEIPMRGRKKSFNVSVACGIALFSLRGTI